MYSMCTCVATGGIRTWDVWVQSLNHWPELKWLGKDAYWFHCKGSYVSSSTDATLYVHKFGGTKLIMAMATRLHQLLSISWKRTILYIQLNPSSPDTINVLPDYRD